MKEKKWSSDGNQMLVDTGHKTFDRQTVCLSTGNVISSTQLSGYIRAFNDVRMPPGYEVEPGHLQAFDLDSARWSGLPNHVRKRVVEYAVDKSVILYKFRHFSGNREIVDGWVLTDADYHLLFKAVTGPTYKSYEVIDECTKYITVERDNAS